jgi:2-hydroxychromene-2-carboxylate isomerase
VESPLMPLFVVMAIERNYFDHSKLSDEEKAEGRQSLKRFVRGAFDEKIKEPGIDSVMSHVADRRGDDRWHLRQSVSDEELRAALAEAKKQADEAGIPDAPENIDPSDEVKRIIDESLKQQ